ncbi:peptide chain release factor N(5)-glutamine methyltransferase [Carboxylicivirga linearis]|uniref:Release factor glutamine methyltransferase n=1 Tax=Carboxylicivirga linearis TaxID=1628157 RepID=A0ABS5JPZ3_9BACT|nr:peptide chain release factor N(5)-glutamine methyltransferase [Carboxylicivirga linearis]MBS2096905.1 peptide chain release factor N(5)-glutamine methyltransferase [Carboxylicivirga linearis]
MALSGIQHFKTLLTTRLKNIYPEHEITQFSKLILQDVLNVTPTQLLLLNDDCLKEDQATKLEEIIKRLAQSEPLQYILGHTEFYDLVLNVSPAVLIPRSETEELVHWILNDSQTNKSRILDIGTGSGCIPLALKNNLPDSDVEAWDISDEALQIARQNGKNLQLDVNFKKVDVLQCSSVNLPFTCIVSNPPYVRNLEKKLMEDNVLKHEPHLALFVEDNDPLIFYRTIAQLGKKALVNKGSLFFEINEYLEQEMTNLLKDMGYIDIECRKDLQGKARMMKATLA